MSVENRRLLFKGGLAALAVGGCKMMSPDSVSAQNPKTESNKNPKTPLTLEALLPVIGVGVLSTVAPIAILLVIVRRSRRL